MPYATLQDLVDRFGYEQLAQLSDRDAGAVVDEVVVDRALAGAGAVIAPPARRAGGGADGAAAGRARADPDAEIDGYLAALYALPLTTVPALLVRMACDLARYRLFGDRVTEQVRQLYTDAVRDLKATAGGANKIDGAAPLAPSSASTTIRVSAPAPIFGSDKLGGY